MDREYLRVGKLVNTQGVKGEVRVIAITDFPEERFQPGKHLLLTDLERLEPVELVVRSYRRHKNFHILSFEDHDSIHDVEPYKGGLFVIPKEEELVLPQGEYYFHEILGCEVYDEEDHYVGTVKEILQPGANDVWVVDVKEQKEDLLLPVIDECIKHIDTQEKKITVHIMEGLQ